MVVEDNVKGAKRNREKLNRLQEKGITNIGIYNEEYPISNGIKYYNSLIKRGKREGYLID
jgi:hypothetical protein